MSTPTQTTFAHPQALPQPLSDTPTTPARPLARPLGRPQPLSDTLTMFGRNLLHNVRNPTGPIIAIVGGAIILLLFVYVFGGTLGAGLTTGGTRSDYLAYITPAIMVMGAVGITQMIAVWIAMDMSEGIIARFRTMAIAPSSVLAGHAYSGIVLVFVSTAPLLGLAVLLGYRPHADGLQWLALAGLTLLVGIALSWLAVAFGLAARGVETASNLPLLLLVLTMVSSGFSPVDSFPAWLHGFAEYQPFTPIINTFRGLLAGSPEARDALWAIGWSLAIAVIGYVWSRWLYRRRTARQ
jgi:ABC-2 type transport system permease protein